MQPWTYSQLDKFETCARQFYHVKVKRDVVEPPTEHTIWGKRVHDAFEAYIKEGTPFPEGMQQWQPVADKIVSLPGMKLAEYKLSIDRNFKPVEWDQAWARGIADLVRSQLRQRCGARLQDRQAQAIRAVATIGRHGVRYVPGCRGRQVWIHLAQRAED